MSDTQPSELENDDPGGVASAQAAQAQIALRRSMQTGIVRTFSKTSSSPLLAEQTHTQVCLTGVGLLLSHRVFTQHHTNLTSHHHMLAVVHAVSHTVNLTAFGGRWWIRCRSYLMAGCLAFVSAASTPFWQSQMFAIPSACVLLT